MSLTKVTHSMISGASVNALDFIPSALHAGISDGSNTTPVDSYLQLAINAAANKTLKLTGIFLIGATLDVNYPTKIVFGGGAGILGPSSYIKKSATCAGDALIIYPGGIGTVVEGGGVVGVTGNTGNGVRVLANSVTLRNVVVTGCGGSGFRIGSDTAYPATDHFDDFTLTSCKAYANGEHGLYIHDPRAAADANGGTVMCFSALHNGLDGIRIGNAYWNSFIGTVCEQNLGWGINCQSAAGAGVGIGSFMNNFVGGDIEGNAGVGAAGGYGVTAEWTDNGVGSSFDLQGRVVLPEIVAKDVVRLHGTTTSYVGGAAVPTTSNSAFYFPNGATGLNYCGSYFSGSVDTDVFIGKAPDSLTGNKTDSMVVITITAGVPKVQAVFSVFGISLPQLGGGNANVTAGANDSAGTGFKYLRVPN